MSSNFFRLSPRMQTGIASVLGWSSLRPVQELAIKAILAGNNCMVLAPTAGGKTEAAFFPVLDLIYRERLNPVSCLYVSPLRALLNNQEPRVEQLASLVGLSAFKWHGDVGQSARRAFLHDPTMVLLTTPESLEVMLISPNVNKGAIFANLHFAIVDEVHAFAADDRGAHLIAVLERIQDYSQYDIQRIGLSATVGNPEQIGHWLNGSSHRPLAIVNPPQPPTERLIEVHALDAHEDVSRLTVPLIHGKKSLFFVESRRDAEAVGNKLEQSGISVHVHHSSVGRDRREEAEASFSQQAEACIVCTSTMELGIDIGDLDTIVQLDAPGTVSSFMQRMGRSGRRVGSRPHIVFLATDDWKLLLATSLVNLARRGWIEAVTPSGHALLVLVHQILAQALQHSGVRVEHLWKLVQKAACFSAVSRTELDVLVQHLVHTGILYDADGLLTLGVEGEARFGRRNFLELYSVFETPQQVTVITTQHQDVGTLETWFVQTMETGEFVFVLAGRPWRAVHLDLDSAILLVEPEHTGQIPRWSSSLRLLSRDIAEEHRAILLSNEQYPFLHRRAQAWLDRLRIEWRNVLMRGSLPIVLEGKEWLLHTFAGGRINTLLARVMAQQMGVQVTSDNFAVHVGIPGQQGEHEDQLGAALQCIAASGFFDDARLRQLTESLPPGRLAKFQDLLPPDLKARFIAERLFDPQGVQDVLCQGQGNICSL